MGSNRSDVIGGQSVASGLPFTKMEAAGNDFVVVDARAETMQEGPGREHHHPAVLRASELPALARSICDRHLGVGADGLILLREAALPQADLEMVFLNPDGSPGGMCGNGARCFALFASLLGRSLPVRFHVGENVYTAGFVGAGVAKAGVAQAGAGLAGVAQAGVAQVGLAGVAEATKAHHIWVDFPFTLQVSQVNANCEVDPELGDLYLSTPGTPHVCWVLKDGVIPDGLNTERNQNTVHHLLENDTNGEWMKRILKVRHHPYFAPVGTNVNLIEAMGDSEAMHRAKEEQLRILTFEKGVEAFTLSCGTGAIASALSWDHHSRARDGRNNSEDLASERTLVLHNRGGQLNVTFHRRGDTFDRIRLAGPARRVFSGVFHG